MVKKNHMKKTILFLTVIFILAQTVQAQINWRDYSFSPQNSTGGKDSPVGIVIAVNQTNQIFNEDVIKGNANTREILSGNRSFLKKHCGNLVTGATFDSTKVQFFLAGVTKKDFHSYEFRVIKWDDDLLVPWTKIKRYGSDVSPKDTLVQSLAYIGGFITEKDQFIVDVRKTGTNKIVATAAIFSCVNVPHLLSIYTAKTSNEFLKGRTDSNHISKEEIIKWNNQHPEYSLIRNGEVLKSQRFPTAQNNLLFSFSTPVVKGDLLEYELVKNHRIIRSWNSNGNGNGMVWLKELKPGGYSLRFRYNLQPDRAGSYSFTILAPWYQTHKRLIATWIFLLGLMVLAVFLVLLYRQKQKVKKEMARKEKLQLELKAIYAQLNPHFVFNALSSIQGLINKKDIEGANMYLSDFARLMRDTMTNSNKEQTSLKEELITLETYLKLEQLRFGFKFEIKTNDVNIYETEIPSLLLQPLIENAVKHGVSSLREEGFVNLLFSKAINDMVVEIQDNGEGFVINEVENGYGLKLTRDRIKLLNQIMNGQSIELNIKGNIPSGTIVSLQFKNWFL